MTQGMQKTPAWMVGLLLGLLLFTGGPLWSQSVGTIRGRVTGVAEQPVTGALVGLVGNRSGDRTTTTGTFVLNGVSAGAYTLRVQMIGYGVVSKPVTVTSGQTAVVDFQLSQVALALNEIVVTGTAGEQTRRSQPAQVGVLNTEEMMRTAPKVGIAQILQSSLPGVSVTQGGGATGASQRIRIRGASSISLSNEPLVFIDGIRADSRLAGEGGGSGSGTGGQGVSRMNDLNPEDIASIEVVKGPAAATLYGADASAGVIQIITKQGRAGSFQQSISAEADVIDANWTPPVNWGVCSQAELNANTPVCRGLAVGTLVSDNPLVREGVFKTGQMRQVNWSGMGGTPAFRYYLSLGNQEETGVFPASVMRRNTGRANSTWSIRPDLTLNVGFGMSTTYNRQPDDNHSLYGFGANAGIGSPLTLGLANNGWLATRFEKQIAAIKNTNQNTRFTPRTELNHQPAAWFNQKLVVGADFSGESRLKMVPKNDSGWYSASDNPGFVREQRINYRLITADYLGHIRQSFGREQSWGSELAFGAQLVLTTTDVVSANGTGLATNSARVVSATAQTNGGQTFTDVRSLGYLGQWQVSYKNRIYAQTGLRMDRSSSFGDNVGSIFLPKLGASWVISEEGFMQRRFPKISMLRLRAAYGVTGRAPLAGTSLETWSPSPAAQTGTNQPGLDLLNPGNPLLKPERGSEFETGIDASFLADRIGVELTYFKKTTNDLILQQQLPTSKGYAQNPFVNIGEVVNKGIEASITAQLLDWRRHAWDVRVSASTLKNELTDLGGIPAFGTSSRFNKGYEIAAFFARRVKSVDVANNRAVVSDTLEYMGTQFPKFEVAFFSNMTLFGNWRVTAQVDGKAGHYLYNQTEQYRTQSVVRTKKAVAPKQLSDDARLQQFGPFVDSKGATVSPNAVAEPYYEKADFLRFRELAVTYSLPTSWARRARAQRATITAGGRNLKLWTSYTGGDPETISRGDAGADQFGFYEFFNLPPSRRFFFRMNLDY